MLIEIPKCLYVDKDGGLKTSIVLLSELITDMTEEERGGEKRRGFVYIFCRVGRLKQTCGEQVVICLQSALSCQS